MARLYNPLDQLQRYNPLSARLHLVNSRRRIHPHGKNRQKDPVKNCLYGHGHGLTVAAPFTVHRSPNHESWRSTFEWCHALETQRPGRFCRVAAGACASGGRVLDCDNCDNCDTLISLRFFVRSLSQSGLKVRQLKSGLVRGRIAGAWSGVWCQIKAGFAARKKLCRTAARTRPGLRSRWPCGHTFGKCCRPSGRGHRSRSKIAGVTR